MPEFAVPFLEVFGALWGGGWLIASVVYRRMKGKPIVPRAPSDAVFHESWRSGRSLRNMLTRIGGARNCLMVYVQGNELVVTPKFPFTLLFMPEVFGLEVRTPVASISAVERISGPIGLNLRIAFAQGGPPPMELKLRDEDGLIRHLGKTATRGRE
jgi:hypothetical protein